MTLQAAHNLCPCRFLLMSSCWRLPMQSILMHETAGGAHVAAADVADARLEADYAVAQAVHDGLALPRHALARKFRGLGFESDLLAGHGVQ